MLIDTDRLNDFFKHHKCVMNNDATDFESKLIYANHKTNKWESVLEQIRLDIELEIKWNELEDILFIENENGDLVLNSDWDIYKAGTYREEIWQDMFSKYSGEDLSSSNYKDIDYLSKNIFPENIKRMFLNHDLVIKINNEKEDRCLYNNIDCDYNMKHYPYDPEFKYYYFGKDNIIYANCSMKNIVNFEGIRQCIDFKDIFKIF